MSDQPGGPWLSVVGIGEDGVDGLAPAARALIGAAERVVGGRRHLELAASLIRGEAIPWPSPFDMAPVLEARGRRVCVLASGDPFLFGAGGTLARRLPPDEMRVLPAPSAFSLAAARMGWPLDRATALSLHGRPIELVRPHLQPGARLIALTSDGQGPRLLADLLTADGFGASRLIVAEALGGPRERLRTTRAEAFDVADVDPLNVVGIEVAGEGRVLPRAPGLPDDWFEHDGQLTKREVRAGTLSALAPRRGELLWDIGAGAGSVAIEWMLADPSLAAVAVEVRSDRAARVAANALAFGVPGLKVVKGQAPAALDGLATPDAIFLGGGAGDPGVLDAVVDRLRPGGRLVANAVTLETEALLLSRYAGLGGALTRLSVARAVSVGSMTGWRAAMPVTQWSWTKP